MFIRHFREEDIDGVINLWNKACSEDMPYKPFTREGFIKKFLENPHYCPEGTFVAVDGDTVYGFSNGLFKLSFLPGETHENTPGYLTFVLVDKNYRRMGLGTELYRKVEEFLRVNGKKQVQVIFFNPINLEWYIPGTDRHDHPNAPGVDVDSPGYEFLLKQGFKEVSRELSMHLDLTNYTMSDDNYIRQQKLNEKGIYIEFYDDRKHKGFDELFDHLRHEYWRKEIKDNLALETPRPILVAIESGIIRGFAGPIAVQPSGRGWFAGIGVDPAFEGLGIGSVLFARLMESFRQAGAKFSTLFTGSNNPARKIYDRTGFRVVKTWAVMRKEL